MFEIKEEVLNIPVELCSFWELPDGEMEELKWSIQKFGIITPIIVRRREEDYQVCFGQRQLLAAMCLQLNEIPGIVRQLNDEEIQVLRLEDSITEKCLSEEPPSRIAKMVADYHNRLRRQGCRTDLVSEVRNLTLQLEKQTQETFRPVGEKWDSCCKVGTAFGLSPRTISRYLRVDMLCDELKQALDGSRITFRTAVELSFLDKIVQERIGQMIFKEGLPVNWQTSSFLRKCSVNPMIEESVLREVLKGSKHEVGNHLTLKSMLVKYGLHELKLQDALLIIDKALQKFLVEGQNSVKVSGN